MSTKSSIVYDQKNGMHIFYELLDGNVYLELERDDTDLLVKLVPTERWMALGLPTRVFPANVNSIGIYFECTHCKEVEPIHITALSANGFMLRCSVCKTEFTFGVVAIEQPFNAILVDQEALSTITEPNPPSFVHIPPKNIEPYIEKNEERNEFLRKHFGGRENKDAK